MSYRMFAGSLLCIFNCAFFVMEDVGASLSSSEESESSDTSSVSLGGVHISLSETSDESTSEEEDISSLSLSSDIYDSDSDFSSDNSDPYFDDSSDADVISEWEKRCYRNRRAFSSSVASSSSSSDQTTSPIYSQRKKLSVRDKKINKRQINQLTKLFLPTGALDRRIKFDIRYSDALEQFIDAIIDGTEEFSVEDKVNTLKLFLLNPKVRRICESYIGDAIVAKVMQEYYHAIIDLEKQIVSKKAKEPPFRKKGQKWRQKRGAFVEIEYAFDEDDQEIEIYRRRKPNKKKNWRSVSRSLYIEQFPLIPIRFRQYILDYSKAKGIEFVGRLFEGRERLDSAIAKLGRLRNQAEHLDFRKFGQNQRLVEEMGYLFDDDTGGLCIQLRKNKERTILDYAIALSSLIDRGIPLPSDEKKEYAAKIVNVLDYFFSDEILSATEEDDSRNSDLAAIVAIPVGEARRYRVTKPADYEEENSDMVVLSEIDEEEDDDDDSEEVIVEEQPVVAVDVIIRKTPIKARFDVLNPTQKGTLLFTYLCGLHISGNERYPEIANDFIIGSLAEYFEFCSANQQLRSKLDYARYLHSIGAHSVAADILKYYKNGPGRQVIEDHASSISLGRRISNLYWKYQEAARLQRQGH